MKSIAILGVGAIGSNLTNCLVADNRGNWNITVLDFDDVTERNITAGTQFYLPSQIGLPKCEALQFNIFQWYEKEVSIINEKLTWENADKILVKYADGLIVDCFDNHEARLIIHDRAKARHIDCIHIGFNPSFTFSCEWEPSYSVPTDLVNAPDICEQRGAGSFIKMASASASSIIQHFLETGEKKQLVGNRFFIREIK